MSTHPVVGWLPFMRRLVLMGNCQAQVLWQLYLRFVAGGAQQPIAYVRSYNDISDSPGPRSKPRR